MQESNANEIPLRTLACFIGYDTQTGKVLYVHEVMSDDKSMEQCDDNVNIATIRHKVAREFPGYRMDVIEAPRGFELRQGTSYRVVPKSKIIEPLDEPTTFREFLNQEFLD